MKNKREVLKTIAKNGDCTGIKCNECPNIRCDCEDFADRLKRIGAMAILRQNRKNRKKVEEKKLKWTDLKIGDVITRDDTIALVTQIDEGCNRRSHIRAGDMWIPDTILEEWKK